MSEAGASVYSASDVAREELPDLDVSLRGAVSIARRLQDPLAELVKIDPKSIGVGQYQHDVDQHAPQEAPRRDRRELREPRRRRGEHGVGALLSYVAGIGPTLAAEHRAHARRSAAASARAALLDVPRLGAKAFEQAAGFLRVRGGAHPLDASAVHPERYALVERMAADLGVAGRGAARRTRRLSSASTSRATSPTTSACRRCRTSSSELRKPGPRPARSSFEPPAFRDDVTEPKDLAEGMVLEGVVTNIVAFGAFVDVGVHQDGLVHVSQLADRFVRDPNEVVKVGQRVKVA